LAVSTTDFEAIIIGLAAPAEIERWSYGEVKKPETINYRTYKPERDGLFCERIFGPSRDWECHCGKYKKIKFKGIVCDRCGVEVTRRKVRRERLGHIALASSVCHSWYLKGSPSPISLLLDMSTRLLEEVVYFASYIVTQVDRSLIDENQALIIEAVEEEIEALTQRGEAAVQDLRQKYEEGLERQARLAAEGEEEPEEYEELFGVRREPSTTIMTEEELSRRIQQQTELAAREIEELQRAQELLFGLSVKQLVSEMEFRRLQKLAEVCARKLGAEFRGVFHAGLGAEAVQELLSQVDLEELVRELRQEIEESGGARQARAVKRLKVAEALRNSKNRPEWMVLSVVPVLPPELRPMVQLDGGRFATSDLNDLYRRVINRNNRLRRIMEINAPDSIINHERRLLQEAVDALIDNSRRRRPVTGSNRRPLKSLSDMLKGKEGRFRKNLLGKRVDYSGRSVIVVGPELSLHQCGLPREMALELFKPHVMSRLVDQGLTSNIKTAKRMVDRMRPEVWDALEEVTEGYPVLLNRAPTLHRLGIQAFEPVLIDGKAIQLHPLVCQAFNADFDGDQMAVHVPLSAHAQAEARLLMLASHNLFKPADGSPIAQPLYDIVLGCYYMTQENPHGLGAGHIFESTEAVISAYENRQVDLHAPVGARVAETFIEVTDGNGEPVEIDAQLQAELRRAAALTAFDEHPPHERMVEFTLTDEMIDEAQQRVGASGFEEHPTDKFEWMAWGTQRMAADACLEGRCFAGVHFKVGIKRHVLNTTVGRAIFNHYLPLDMPYINHDVAKSELAELVSQCYRTYGQGRTAQLLDDLKTLGFRFATRSGLSICIADTDVPTEREKIIARAEREVQRINRQARDGIITDDEREQEVLRQWQRAGDNIADQILQNISTFNSIWMMTNSGARANRSHISQIAGMRGLMSDPFGRLIEDLPVKSNFHEGLNILEYFVSTHGARKGLADTALRTADAGYLTRRLVDVSQEVMIRADDCGTTEGVEVHPIWERELHCPECGAEDFQRTGVCAYCESELPTIGDDEIMETLQERTTGRVPAVDILDPRTNEVLVAAGREIDERLAGIIVEAGIKAVLIRSPLTCRLRHGICAKCYGRDLATHRSVEVGTAVGIVAAQSIGEPGTQLTMRTFHYGGVAGEYITGVADVKKRKQQALRSLNDDIGQGRVSLDAVGGSGRARRKAIKEMLKVLETSVHGLLRVVELFEARTPKGQAITAQIDGRVAEIQTKGLRTVVIHSEQSLEDLDSIRGETLAEDTIGPGGELLARAGAKLLKKVRDRLAKAGVEKVKITTSHLVPHRGELFVREGTEVHAGDRLTGGPVDPESILQKKGIRGVQDYLVREIQAVYRAQGVSINDKHIETIVSQMLRRRSIVDHGDTRFLPGEVVDRFDFADENERVRRLGGQPAIAEPMLLGITQASLATDSFLSAASFQRTTRVLSEAACENRRDPLLGLKENVIIGRLIPAGSGMPRHRDRKITFHPDVEEELRPRPRDVLPETDAMQALLEEIEAARGLAGEEDLKLIGEEFLEEEIPEAVEEEAAEK